MLKVVTVRRANNQASAATGAYSETTKHHHSA